MEDDVQRLPLAAIKGLYRRAQATTRRNGQIRMGLLDGQPAVFHATVLIDWERTCTYVYSQRPCLSPTLISPRAG